MRIALRDASRSRKLLTCVEQGELVSDRLKRLKLTSRIIDLKICGASRSRKLLADAEQGDFTQTQTSQTL